jgi:hypothetical protein
MNSKIEIIVFCCFDNDTRSEYKNLAAS